MKDQLVTLVAEEGFGLRLGVNVSAWLMSWTCPPVRLSASGLPKASTITWILVVRPPRERPMAWSRPPFCVRPHYADEL